MNRPRLLRGLRIAWSAWWGLLCVLLIVLWVRSYNQFDWWGPGSTVTPVEQELHPNSGFVFESARGALAVWYVGNLRNSAWYSWSVGSWTAEPNVRVTGDDGESASDGFRAKIYPNGSFKGSVPHWFLIVVSGALATSAWVRLRWSLRTLLIATTLLAVFLGLVVWAGR